MGRRFGITVCVVFLACAWGFTQDKAKPDQGKPPAQAQPPADLAQDQEVLARKYSQLERTLLAISQKLEKSGSPEAVRKSIAIRKALEEAKNKGISLNLNH